MGVFQPTDKCLITGAEACNHQSDRDAIEYWVVFGKHRRFLRLPNEAASWLDRDDGWLIKSQHILKGLFLNGKWFSGQVAPSPNNTNVIEIHHLGNFLINQEYPKTPKEKRDNLFIRFFQLQEYDGDKISWERLLSDDWDHGHYRFFFRSKDELDFYLNTLTQEGLISAHQSYDDVVPTRFSLTFRGLEEAISLQETNQFSTNAFVAMSFGEAYLPTYQEGIAPALTQTGFTPQRVDQVHLESGVTINDSIIAMIKKCRFMVADFSGNSPGVYTEAGIGIGRDMKVIYCCQEDYFEAVHFDMNHFPFIKYKTPEDLRQKLIDKIEAWVI